MEELSVDYEPMDVDTSFSSINAKDISVTENDEPDCKSFVKTEKIDACTQMNNCDFISNSSDIISKQVWNVKKYHLNIPRPDKKKTRRFRSWIKVVFTSMIVLGVSVITHQITNFKCTKVINIKNIENALYNNIFGQPVAINDIVRALLDNSRSKILFLYGGTGVGKTYAVSLILEDYWPYSNVYHYTMPSFAEFTPDFMVGLTFCESSILVVDDLTAEDMYIKGMIQELIAKSENLRKNLTVILVFNCDNVSGNFVKKCDESFFLKLKEEFGDINASKKYIEFLPLSEDHLKKCILRELGTTIMTQSKMKLLLKNFDVTLDGCKGVHNKIKFMNVL